MRMILLSSLPLLGGFIVWAKYLLFVLAVISFVGSALNFFEFDHYRYDTSRQFRASTYHDACCADAVCGCVFLAAGLLSVSVPFRDSAGTTSSPK